MRLRLLAVFIGAVLVALTFTFPVWQPLFQGEDAGPQRALPGLPDDLEAVFQALPADQQAAYQVIAAENIDNVIAMLNASIQQPVQAPSEMELLPSLTGPVRIGTGTFQRIDVLRWGQGDVVIYEEVDDDKLLRLENFNVANGPNLRVVLSASSEPLTVDAMRQDNLDIDLGQLAGTVGNQNYEVPADTDMSRYRTVVIYSPSVNLIYAYAPLFITQ
ncbi:MAG: DM13 domain-containing protein [Pleurocapsa minor GSE-CHR-MK-17-07R]|jgi:hypothetical protein|nr:DM13 domain-containing protein [Pleurocapsa minor GSE-CHR-MK 17-07R]